MSSRAKRPKGEKTRDPNINKPMNKNKEKQILKERRHKRVRAKVSGTADCPRLSVFRSLNHISAQVIDDVNGVTLVSVKDVEVKTGKTRIEKATEAGKLVAKKATEKGIKKVVFDKSSYKYHGRVKALADGAREGGLVF